MESDSGSQDSDDGRRFRFATTRKDGQSRRKSVSPKRNRRRSRSKNRDSRDERTTKRSSDRSSSSRRGQTEDKKDRKEGRRQQEKEYRSHTKDSKNGRDHRSSKGKREKHNRRSREKSSESSERKKEESKKLKTESSLKTVVNKTDEKVNAEVRTNGSSGCSSNSIDVVVSDIMLIEDNVIAQTSGKKPKSFFDRVVNKRAIESNTAFGSALPSNLEKRWFEAKGVKSTKKEEIINEPTIIGPALPPNFITQNHQDDERQKEDEEMENLQDEVKKKEDEEEEDEMLFGPALPPHMERRKVVGPMLPENFCPTVTNNLINVNEENEDDTVFGPLPVDDPAAKDSLVQMQLEYRALKVKEKLMDKVSKAFFFFVIIYS